MHKIEKRFPKLVNCFGRIRYDSRKCTECKHAWECDKFAPTLENPDFWPGKYREGFGKPKKSVKGR